MAKNHSVPAPAIAPIQDQPRPVPVEQMTVTELKALAYEQFVLLQQTQNNINILQAELAKRR